jgi:hypothetical protein
MARRPEKVDRFEPDQDRGEAANYTENGIEHRRRDEAAPKKKERFIAESGKRCETTKQPGEEEQARLDRKQIVMLDEAGQQADDEAAKNVHAKCTEWEVPGFRVMEDQAPNFVAGHRPNRAAERYHEDLFRFEHAASVF